MSIGVRQRTQEDGVYNAKDGGVRTDTKSEREDCHCRKPQAFAKHSCAKAQILDQLVEYAEAASLSAFLFSSLDAAKFKARSAHGLLARNAASNQLLCKRVDVETKLSFHLGFQ